MLGVWIKRLLSVVALLAVVGGFAWALREKPVLSDLAEAKVAPMKVTILQEAKTRVRNVYSVSAPIAGNLERIVIDEGSKVIADKTLIASIRPLDPPFIDKRSQAELKAARDAAKAAVSIARINYNRAQTALEFARSSLERAQRLADTRIIPESQLQKASTAVDDAEGQVESTHAQIGLREAELATAEARLIQPGSADGGNNKSCCVSIIAPVDGVVLNVYAKSEQPVAAGMKIADIGDTSKLEVVVGLLSTDAVKVKPGEEAEIVNWGGPPLKAVVRRIDPAAYTKVSALGIEEQRVNAILDLKQTDPRLGHNFRVYAKIATWQSDKVLQVPIAALFRHGDDWHIFTVVDGRAHERAVSIGHMNNTQAEILGGLKAGDKVVLYPSDKISDGSLIESRPQ
jgi:HlyD family secretion protein